MQIRYFVLGEKLEYPSLSIVVTESLELPANRMFDLCMYMYVSRAGYNPLSLTFAS